MAFTLREASRYHERFVDHAVSVAKKVQYLAEGGEFYASDGTATGE